MDGVTDAGNGIAPAGWSRDARLKSKRKEIQMKTITKAVSVLFLGSVLCLAETWSGKVVDAACKDQAAAAQSAQPGGKAANACEPTASTAAFGIELSDGKVLKLDSAGNTKAAEAMKTNAGKSSLQATVTGSLDGQTVKVETIEIK
jgi:hypothetical protein